ncbi:MAG: D-alanyl-D-alanine carboxypeptidase family protein [Rickettsiales bacterium]
MKCNLRIILLVVLFILPISPISTLTSFDARAEQSQETKKISESNEKLHILRVPTKELSTKELPAKKKSTKKYTAKKKSTKKKYSSKKKSSGKKSAIESKSKFSALVVNANTGRVLYEKAAGGTRYPASLTKMMTLYLTFDAIKKGKLKMSDTLKASKKASMQQQTNISLKEGEKFPVRTAVESVIVRSANDSAVVLAEALGGTVWNFSLMMTKKARALGMKNTVFRNPHGLPDNQQFTTAYDMAKLGIALRRDFPEYYPMFKLTSFSHNGITYRGHNRVMARYSGVDGIKTGYINASGFNLVTSVKKDGYNLIAVIMGGTSSKARDDEMVHMLDRTFASLESKKRILSKSQELAMPDSL